MPYDPPSFGFRLVGCPVPSALFDGFVRITILKALPIRPHSCFCCNSDDQTSMSLLTFITWLICRKGLLYCWKLHIYNAHMLIFFTSLSCSQHLLCSLLNGHQNAKEQLLRKVGRVGFSLKPWKLQNNLAINCSEHYSKVYNLLCSELLWQGKMLWNCLSSLISVL